MIAPLVVCDRWSVPHPLSPIDYRCVNPRPAPLPAKQCQCGDPATLKASKIRQPGNETCDFCWRQEWAEQPAWFLVGTTNDGDDAERAALPWALLAFADALEESALK